MKKWLAMLLCIVMLLSMLPTAIAEEDEQPDTELPEVEAAGEPAQETSDIELPEIEPAEEPEGFVEPVEEQPMASVPVNASYFPDANFRAWIKANITGGSDTLTQAQMDAVTSMDCMGENIASLKGISRFKNLEYLYCGHNALTSLDLDNNKKLLVVYCEQNQLTKLSISACTNLYHLNASNNKFTSINVSYNKNLEGLFLDDNQLAKLNVESNPKLVELSVANNKLTEMKTAKNTNLRILDLDRNQISKLNLANNTELTHLSVNRNKLTALDVTANTKLVSLSVNYNNLTALDVTKTTKLEELDASFNALKSINVTKNTKLKELNVNENGDIKALNVSKNTALTVLKCDGNQIKALDVTNCTKLVELSACGNLLRALDVTKNTELTHLGLFDNGICAIDLSKNTKLKELGIDSNMLGALDVKNCKELTYLDCGNNQIKSLNLNNNTKLQVLYCQCNQLEFLSLGSCTQLVTLDCSANHIRAMHLTNNTKLVNPDISNQVTSDALNLTYSGGKYLYNMSNLFESGSEANYVKPYDSTYSYNSSTRMMTMPGNVTSFKYRFDTGRGDMIVVVNKYYSGDFTVEFSSGAVEYKGTTPYVVYTGSECRPDFVVKKSNGQYISQEDGQYGFWYTDNVKPGTGMLHVRMYGSGVEKTLWFKIYMPATTGTTVENISTGIWITWKAVKDAKGYVIYRRAWNLASSGWTDFQRWNNTTDTEWLDEKVYAGTRYQYGIKAYYSDPMDNYNLGLVGPLKTTVRITTRTLNSVTPGSKQITAKWSGSKNFTGYEVQVATDQEFKQNVKTVKIEKASTVQTTIKNLKGNTTYYVRVRSYHIFDGTTYYGGWSTYKTCKTKA